MEWTVGTAAELKVAFSDPRLQQAAWSCTGAPCELELFPAISVFLELQHGRERFANPFLVVFWDPLHLPGPFPPFLVLWWGEWEEQPLSPARAGCGCVLLCPTQPSDLWQRSQKIYTGKRSISLTKDAEETGYSHTKMVKIGPSCPVQKQIQYLAKPLM